MKTHVLSALMASLLVVQAFAAEVDLRLVNAAKDRDAAAVRSLVRQKVNVNTPQPDGATALLWAAHWNDLDTTDLLIRAGAKVNAANLLGVTALREACVNASAEMVGKLLKAGADPNLAEEAGVTPLMMCSRTGNLEAVKALMEKGADVNAKESRESQTALMWAVSNKRPAIVKALIEHGADVHARSRYVLLPAAKSDKYSFGDGFYEGDFRPVSKGGFTPLLFAAQQGDLESAKILLAAGAEVNEASPDGNSALLRTSANAHEELAIFLLEKGANPKAADENGMTALHYTVLKGLMILRGMLYNRFDYMYRPPMPALAEALLKHGAQANARLTRVPEQANYVHGDSSVGASPYLIAGATEDVRILKAMAAAGADPNLTTENGYTALMMAAGLNQSRMGNPQVGHSLDAVKAIVEAGGDVNKANDLGLTALHIAAAWGRNEMVQYLVEKGANVNAKDTYGETPWSLASDIYPPGTRLRKDNIPRLTYHKDTADLLIKLGANQVSFPGGPKPAKQASEAVHAE